MGEDTDAARREQEARMKRLEDLFLPPEKVSLPEDYASLGFPLNPPWFSPEEAEELASTISEVHKTQAGVYIALGPPLPPEIVIGFVSIAVATGFLNMSPAVRIPGRRP